MKNKFYITALVLAAVTGLQSCELVGGIFKAGAATGIIIVVVVIAFILFLISRIFKRK